MSDAERIALSIMHGYVAEDGKVLNFEAMYLAILEAIRDACNGDRSRGSLARMQDRVAGQRISG